MIHWVIRISYDRAGDTALEPGVDATWAAF